MNSLLRIAGYCAEPEQLRDVVTTLREIERESGLDHTLAVGGLVLERFFGGRIDLWRSRKRNKNNSIRRLAQHPDCPLSRSALNYCIAVYVAMQELRTGSASATNPVGQAFRHVGASHVGVVLPLPPSERAHWLEHAEQKRWTVRELKQHVTHYRSRVAPKRGRPHASQVQRTLGQLRSNVEAVERIADGLSELSLEPGARTDVELLAERLNRAAERISSTPPAALVRSPSQVRIVRSADALEDAG